MRQLPMGKLADLWAELSTLEKLEDKERVQKKINGIEQWCIDNKFGNFKELTDWTKPIKKKKGSGGSYEPFSFKSPDFIYCGHFIKPYKHFCRRCGLDTEGLLTMGGQLLHV